MLAAVKVAMPAGRVECTGTNASAVGANGQAGLLQEWMAATAGALAALPAANAMVGTDGVRVAFPSCLSFLLGLQRREGRDDGAGYAWASFVTFLQLQQGMVVVNFMIQMNSMK